MGVCYPRPHLSIRFEAKHAPRLESLISNIACWAIELVAAGRHCQSPLFGNQQKTSSATDSTFLVTCPCFHHRSAGGLYLRQASTFADAGEGGNPFLLATAFLISPFPCTPSPRNRRYSQTGRDHSAVEIQPSKSFALGNYKAIAQVSE